MRIIDFDMTAILGIYIILLGFLFLFKKVRKKRFQPYVAIWILYVLLLFKVTICPIFIYTGVETDILTQDVLLRYGIQIVPFKTLRDTLLVGTWELQIIGNVLLLLPVPVLLCIRDNKVGSIWKKILVGAGMSLGIEVSQLLINVISRFRSHAVDVDDLIFNITGVCLGMLIAIILYKIKMLDWMNRLLVWKEKE